jgi:hypothetical protein
MSVGLDQVTGRRLAEERDRLLTRRIDQRFYMTMAIGCILIAFIGFARTYYLGSYFGARPLTPLIHIHGVLCTTWLLLFLAQVSLVGVRRTDIHRRLGVGAGMVAALLLIVGYLTAIEAVRLGHAPVGAPSPLAFLAVPIGTLTAFGVPVGLALHYRRRLEIHKRLMLLGTIGLLTPALARMGRLVGSEGPPFGIGGTCLLIFVCMTYDKWAHGRVHPVFLWGGLAVMLSLPFRFAIGTSDAWLSIARWLTH